MADAPHKKAPRIYKRPTPEQIAEFERIYDPLLERRVPYQEVVPGNLYVLFARNASVGIARLRHDGSLGYVIHRNKMGAHFLFEELDWSESDTMGTAIPLRLIEDDPSPPTPRRGEDESELLAWLAVREARHNDEAKAAWREVTAAQRRSPGSLEADPRG